EAFVSELARHGVRDARAVTGDQDGACHGPVFSRRGAEASSGRTPSAFRGISRRTRTPAVRSSRGTMSTPSSELTRQGFLRLGFGSLGAITLPLGLGCPADDGNDEGAGSGSESGAAT